MKSVWLRNSGYPEPRLDKALFRCKNKLALTIPRGSVMKASSKIRPLDLDAVLSALAVPTPSSEALREFTPAQAALLAAAAMTAAGRISFPGRDFGTTIEKLVIDPAVPEAGWSGTESSRSLSRENVMTASRRLGLHRNSEGSGTGIQLQPVAVLSRFLEAPGVHVQARSWFDRHMRRGVSHGQAARMLDPAERLRRRRQMQDEIEGHPLLGLLLSRLDEITLQRLSGDLAELLAKYFPQSELQGAR
jgi:hypothetical protein